MEQIRKAHLLFEQSGTFKNEFIKLGIPAEDYDIQNEFGETDHVIDLFAEIEKAYKAERERERELKQTFESCFYSSIKHKAGNDYGAIRGFPITIGQWCLRDLKLPAIKQANLRGHILQAEQEQEQDLRLSNNQGKLVYEQPKKRSDKRKRNSIGVISYVGIAEDEPERLAKLDGITQISPLHLIGWTEADARKWCEDNGLLSPIYTDTCLRGGCWFCHNQGIQQLRELRHNYPELWSLLMKWDTDSPVSFKADGHTVHDFDKRFELEDRGLIDKDIRWRWSYIDSPPDVQIGLFENEVFK